MLAQINEASFDSAVLVEITWHIQKKWQNGQRIKLSTDTKIPQYAPSVEHCRWSYKPVVSANQIVSCLQGV